VFDTGDIHLGNDMAAKGQLPFLPMFQIVLGIKFGAMASPATRMYMKSLLPEGAVWAAFGLGRMAFPMVAQSFLLGGHQRAGLRTTSIWRGRRGAGQRRAGRQGRRDHP
jgi:uncharacterized protein (DUF849 family)